MRTLFLIGQCLPFREPLAHLALLRPKLQGQNINISMWLVRYGYTLVKYAIE